MVELAPDNYGCTLKDDGSLILVITDEEKLLEDFPVPCSCVKYARKNVYPCRVLNVVYSKFCKCVSGELRQNIS